MAGEVRARRPAVRVGVLALQGDFAAHAQALREHELEPVEVRRLEDLDAVHGLVLPGGESTTMLTLLEGTGLGERLRQLVENGTPVLATCAGVILIAREVHNPPQPSLALLDVSVERNSYGRQLASAVVELRADASALGTSTLEGVFIRAPRLRALGPGVRPLAWRDGEPVLVEQGCVLAATFHPELSPASPVIQRFERAVRERVATA